MSGIIGIILGMLVFVLFIQVIIVAWMGIMTIIKKRGRKRQLEYS